jgi:hypothetical protein
MRPSLSVQAQKGNSDTRITVIKAAITWACSYQSCNHLLHEMHANQALEIPDKNMSNNTIVGAYLVLVDHQFVTVLTVETCS